MKNNLMDRVRDADPYPPTLDLPVIPVPTKYLDHPNPTEPPRPRPLTNRRSKTLPAIFTTAAIAAASVFAVNYVNRTEPTNITTSTIEGKPLLLWPSYIPSGYCLQISAAGGSFVPTHFASIRNGESWIHVTRVPLPTSGTADPGGIVGTQVPLGNTTATVSYTNSAIWWKDKMASIAVLGHDVEMKSLLAAARSFTFANGIPQIQLPGYQTVDYDTLANQRSSMSFTPCTSSKTSALPSLLTVTTMNIDDAPGSWTIDAAQTRKPSVDVKRVGASNVKTQTSPDATTYVQWIENGRRVTVSTSNLTKPDIEKFIANLKTVTTTEWNHFDTTSKHSTWSPPTTDKWQPTLTLPSGMRLFTTVENGIVCTTWYRGSSYAGPATTCRTPATEPVFVQDHNALTTNHALAITPSAITRAIATMPDGTKIVAQSAPIPGLPDANAFGLEIDTTRPLPVSITFYNAQGKTVHVQH